MTYSLFELWIIGTVSALIMYFINPRIGFIVFVILQGILMFIIDKNNEYLEDLIRSSHIDKTNKE